MSLTLEHYHYSVVFSPPTVILSSFYHYHLQFSAATLCPIFYFFALFPLKSILHSAERMDIILLMNALHFG